MLHAEKLCSSGPAGDVRILWTMLRFRWNHWASARTSPWMNFLCCDMLGFVIKALFAFGSPLLWPREGNLDAQLRATISSLYVVSLFDRLKARAMIEVFAETETWARIRRQVNGLPPYIYWLDTCLYHLALSAGFSFLLTIISCMVPVLYRHSSFVLIWLTLTCAHLQYCIMGWLLGRFSRTIERAGQLGCVFFLLSGVAIGFNMFCHNIVVRYAFLVVPLFSVFTTLASIQWLEHDNVGFTSETFFKGCCTSSRSNCGDRGEYVPPGVALVAMCAANVLYMLAIYWLDQTAGNRWGIPRPWLFFLDFSEPRRKSLHAAEHSGKVAPVQGRQGRSFALWMKDVMKVYESESEGSGHKTALNMFSLEVCGGEVFALLGHNGSGKTTMMHCAVGMIPPTSGEILINNVPVAENPTEAQRQLAFCPQESTVSEDITVKQQLELYAVLRGIPASQLESELTSALTRVDLLGKKGLPGSELSGGQRRRLAVAIALLGARPMVLMDEPSAGMDPASRHKLWGALEWVRRQGSAVIFTTHYLDEADFCADRKAILSGGRVKAAGTSLELKKQYAVGYRLTLELPAGTSTAAVRELVARHIPKALQEREKGSRGQEGADDGVLTLAFSLPFSDVDRLGPLLGEIDERKQELGVRDYGLQMSSLEDVFLKLAPWGATAVEDRDDKLQPIALGVDKPGPSNYQVGPEELGLADVCDPEKAALLGEKRRRPNMLRQILALMGVRMKVLLQGGSMCFIITRLILPVVGVNAYIARSRDAVSPQGWYSVAIGFPLSLTTVLGPTMHQWTADLEKKRKLMMMTHGMSPFSYLLAAGITDYFLMLPVVLALPIFAWLGHMPFLSGPGLTMVFVEAFIYPIHLIVFMLTLMSFMKEKMDAANTALTCTASFLGLAVPAGIVWGFLVAACDHWPAKAHLFKYCFGLHNLFSLTVPPYSMPGLVLFVLHESRSAVFVKYHRIERDAEVPLTPGDFFQSRAGVPFFLSMLPTLLLGIRLVRRARSAGSTREAPGEVRAGEEGPSWEEDEGVAAEEARLSSGKLGEEDVVAYRGLHYIYISDTGARVPAVRGVSLGLRRGECFGLLGPNGAGKTTTLACLTGELWPLSAGSIFFEGRDVLREGFEALYGKLGLCLQHDTHLWENLTGMEHLHFYGCVKGVPEQSLEWEIDAVLEHVRLKVRDASRPAGEYSGGMRRRLSMAIALLGRPPMLFMDEPTAGVDAMVKRQLWKVVKSRGADQMLLLTSHQMEEVEALCDRVAIQVLGRLRALGTVAHLRRRYGRGYQLELLSDAQREGGNDENNAAMAKVEAFVHERVYPGAKLVEKQLGRVVFELEDMGEGGRPSLSMLFNEVTKAKTELSLRDYSVRQPTLEQVFIRFANEQEEAEAMQRTAS